MGLPDGHHVLAKIPLRVYTPIPQLEYNTTEAEDIIELPSFINVNVGAINGLSPVVCQAHEPHESLRSVPWFRTPYTDGEITVKPGVFWFSNGVWRNAIPNFDNLTSMQEEIENSIIPSIEDNLDEVNTLRGNTATVLNSIITKYNNIVSSIQTCRDVIVRVKQFAVAGSWLFGIRTVTIPASLGFFDPVGQPNGHCQIDLVDGIGPSVEPGISDKIQTHLYLVYNKVWENLGAKWDMTRIEWLSKQTFAGPDKYVSYRMSRQYWTYLRPKAEKYYQDIGETMPNYPVYGIVNPTSQAQIQADLAFKAKWGSDFGYKCYEYDNETNPVIFVLLSEDNKPQNFLDVYAQLWKEEVLTTPPTKYVRGFKLWFSNFKPSGPTPQHGGIIDTEPRTIKFMWATYGKRKTPPEIWT